MLQLPEIIFQTIEQGKNAYEKVLQEQGSLQYVQVTLDCAQLSDPDWTLKTPGMDINLWEQVKHIDQQPCLYYFEIDEMPSAQVLEHYRLFRADPLFAHRASPTLKKYPPTHKNVLYVGKVKKHIAGRLKQHVGHYHVGATAGLQLVCWAKPLCLKLRMHIFAFPEEMRDFVDPLELHFARSLTPLIGKH
ncbi:MAG: hypothetical protein JNM22_04675 [Saprospiraceae bacterium]|nr:hypothetical protein [Saprospiraceae bacterium]